MALVHCYTPYCGEIVDDERGGECPTCERFFCPGHLLEHVCVPRGTLQTCWASNAMPPDDDGQCGVFTTEVDLGGHKCCAPKEVPDNYLPFIIRRHGHEIPIDLLTGYLRRMAAADVFAMTNAARSLLQMHRAAMLPEQLRAVEEAIGQRDVESNLDRLMHDIRIALLRAPNLIEPAGIKRELTKHGVECLVDTGSLCPECDTSTLLCRYGFLMCGAELRDALMKLPDNPSRITTLDKILRQHGSRLTVDQMSTIEVFIPLQQLIRQYETSHQYRSRVASIAQRAVVRRIRTNWRRVKIHETYGTSAL
jgi:hypothetical protein